MKRIITLASCVLLCLLLTSSHTDAQTVSSKKKLTYEETVQARAEYIAKKKKAAKTVKTSNSVLSLQDRKVKAHKELDAEEQLLIKKGKLTPATKKAIAARRQRIDLMK